MMMNKSIIRIFVLLWVAVAAACTNNGDIGPYYGTWTLDRMTLDGVMDEDYGRNISWAFQNNVLRITVVSVHHDEDAHFATWKETGSGHVLQVNFQNSADGIPPGEAGYAPPPQLHLPKNRIIDFDIVKMTGSKMHLRYVTDDGVTVDYYFTHRN